VETDLCQAVSDLRDRVTATWNRVVRAWDRSWALRRQSHELIQARQRLLGVAETSETVVWTTRKGIECRVKPLADGTHEIRIVVGGSELASCPCGDADATAEEVERLRRLFVG
jgi:hypothetical protein